MNEPEKGGCVLYVEDEDHDIFFMQMAFEEARAGMLITLKDGHQAFQYLSGLEPYNDRTQHPLPDLLLLDLKLPMRNGFEILEWVRSYPATKRMPVIIFTSSALATDVTRAYELGANGFVVKPLGLQERLDFIRAIKRFWFGCTKLPASNPSPTAGSLGD